MIERNLGNIERLTRFSVGLVFIGWALMQPGLNIIEWFTVCVSMALMLNGVFSRCYVWYLLDINTSETTDTATPTGMC